MQKNTDPMCTFFLCAVFYIYQIYFHSLLSASTYDTSPPQGQTLQNISVIMPSEPADKVVEIPVSEVAQETDQEYLVAEVLETLYPEYPEAVLF